MNKSTNVSHKNSLKGIIRSFLLEIIRHRYDVSLLCGPVSKTIILRKLEFGVRDLIPGSKVVFEKINTDEVNKYGRTPYQDDIIQDALEKHLSATKNARVAAEIASIRAPEMVRDAFQHLIDYKYRVKSDWVANTMEDFDPPILIDHGEMGEANHKSVLKALLLPPLGRKQLHPDFWLKDNEDFFDGVLDEIAARFETSYENGRKAAIESDSKSPSVAFVFDVFANTWAPTVSALNFRDIHTVWCGTADLTEEKTYGAAITQKIPTKQKLITDFVGILGFITSLKKTQVLIASESFFSADWNAENATVQCMIIASLLRGCANLRTTGHSRQSLIMYDGVKPLSWIASPDFGLNHNETSLSYSYKSMVTAADKIALNSNVDEFGDFLKYAVPLREDAAVRYIPRYTESAKTEEEKLPFDEESEPIHMCCITTCLSDNPEPSRDGIEHYIKQMIEQGLHFHYYCVPGSAAAARFRLRLSKSARDRFHTHDIITDQAKLVEDIQKYHLGLTPGDHTALSKGIASVPCRFYSDAAIKFMRTTVATSSIVYAAAGLPCMMAMGFPGGATLVGEDTVIQPALSEFKHIKKVLKQWGLRERLKLAAEKRAKFYARNHVDEFITFLDIK